MRRLQQQETGGKTMNKKKYWACAVLVVMAISFASVVFAEEADQPTCNLDLTFYSKYVWRGYELSKDSLVIFPSITVGYKGFDFNVWGDFDTDYEVKTPGTNDTKWWETDWVLSYSNSLDLGGTALNWTLGWIYYDVDGPEYDNEEIFTVLGLDCLLSPEISVWKGIQHDEETWYVKLSVSHSFPLDNGHSIDVGAWAGYYSIEDGEIDDDNVFGVLLPNLKDYDEWHDCTIWAAYNIPVNDWCTITPSINYSFPLSDGAEDNIEFYSFDFQDELWSGHPDPSGDSDWFYGGVNVNIAF
jgi:hypothetical protein